MQYPLIQSIKILSSPAHRSAVGLLWTLLIAVDAPAAETNAYDPWEKSNRGVYAFNDFLDRNFISPVAYGYDFVTPQFVQNGLYNFFNNLGEPMTMMNDMLQLKMVDFYTSLARFGINTVIGIGGFIDVAKHIRLPRHAEDLGQTLGYWGVGAGPYAVLPFLGPSSARDMVPTLLSTIYGSRLIALPISNAAVNTLNFINVLEIRTRLRPREALLFGDRYSLLRDIYVQNREFQVSDGEVQLPDYFWEDELDELDDLEELEELDEL